MLGCSVAKLNQPVTDREMMPESSVKRITRTAARRMPIAKSTKLLIRTNPTLTSPLRFD